MENKPKECAVKFCSICDKYVPISHEHKVLVAGDGRVHRKFLELFKFATAVNAMGDYK